MSRCLPLLSPLLLLSIALCSRMFADAQITVPTAAELAFFETNIRPVLIDKCLDCHSGDEPESGLSMESRSATLRGGELGPALVPGKPAESLIIRAINHGEYLKMPPKDKLPTKELVNFSRWIEMGAPWPNAAETEDIHPIDTDEQDTTHFSEEQKRFWAFQPPSRPTLPTVERTSWPQAPIDYFILARLEEADLSPAPMSDKETLIRRATYDLTGLPPESDHIEAFLADTSDSAFATVVERLLASPQYGERWGRHWLDVARYADSNGLDENLAYANAFHYRDYVIVSFNADKPYDRFVQEQIAGDLLAPDPNQPNDMGRYVATSFLAIGAKMLAEDDPMKMQMDIIDEQLNTLSQAFMGMTIGCCRCHDHKFDPLSTADYYGLAGIFKSTKTMENHKVVAEWYERPLVDSTTAGAIAMIDRQLSANRQAVAEIRGRAKAAATKHIRSRTAEYLLATNAINRFDQQIASRRPNAQSVKTRPHVVQDGYGLIEAEAFHRGDIEDTSEGYGKGIGVILSRGAGFAEYDLEVSHAGNYELEMRYTAAESRPIHLYVNGDAIAAVAEQVTGDWNPPGQTWFAEANLRLQRGRNKIRFQSDSVYPHVDQFALVYSTSETWPFANERPLSLSSIAAIDGLKIETVRQWQSFLKKVSSTDSKKYTAYRHWIALADASRESAMSASSWNETLAAIAKQPGPVSSAITAAAPSTLADVAAVYQKLVDQAKDTPKLKRVLFVKKSPLDGPEHIPTFFSDTDQLRITELNRERNNLNASRPQSDFAMGVTEDRPEDIRIHLRGSHITLGDTVPRRFPHILSSPNDVAIPPDESGRLSLARWLTTPSHPLTSRVMVNRVWHWHFGRGIVASVDNFGKLGEQPTHPMLLDWLARSFIDNNWSIKELHRQMMLSSTYQMSTDQNERTAQVDPENKLFSRMNRRRLSAEEIRDSIISIGQGVDGEMGGTLLKTENHKYVNSTGSAMTASGYQNRRRSVYLPIIRSSVFDVFQTLDFPDPAVLHGRRQTSTVAPQALMMMNSDLVEQQTRHCAGELLDDFDEDLVRIVGAYERVLRRTPSTDEVAKIVDFLSRARSLFSLHATRYDREVTVWQSLCRVLISTNEFVYLD